MSRALVIGYGNPLRGDDGVGWHVAHAVAADPRAAGVTVIAAHQLVPEYAEDLAGASRAVLVDARLGAGLRPGEHLAEPVDAVDGPGGDGPGGAVDGPGGVDTGAWTHHCTPGALTALARTLYGAVPRVTAVGVGVASVEAGDRLTPAVAGTIPSLVDLILELIDDA